MGYEKLPPNIILEILTRTTSLKTLDTSKSVCESWNKLIRDANFMSSYGQRIRNYLSGYFIQDTKQFKYLSMFVSIDQSSSKICMERLPDDMRIIASSNQGILCCLRRRRSIYRYYACKPATKQWKSLPNPKLRYKTAAIAIMVLSSSPLRYKIVRLSRRGNVGSISKYKFEIFDSKIWTWKETQDVELPYYEVICSSNKAVSANNSVYWLTSHDNVLAFHEPEGTFQKFPLPEEVLQDKNKYSFKYKQLVEYKGRLGLVCNTKEGDTELWIMYENTINNCPNWRKEMVMDIGSIVRRVGMRYADVAGFYNEGIAFLNAFYEVVFYNLEDCSFTRVEVDCHLKYAREIFRFRSDLERVNLGRDG